MQLNEIISVIFNNYINETKTSKVDSFKSIFKVVNYNFADRVRTIINRNDLLVKGSVGIGKWTKNPWVAIYNKNITSNMQEGIYIIYIFSSDLERLYLTLNQGCTNIKIKNHYSKSQLIEHLKAKSELLKNSIDSKGFKIDNDLAIGQEYYEKGCIFYKCYNKQEILSEESYTRDLLTMIEVYDDYFKKFPNDFNISQSKGSKLFFKH